MKPHKLFIVGSGLRSNQMSVSALHQIKKSHLVLALTDNESELDGFFRENDILNARFLNNHYQDGARDEDNYQKIYDIIISEAKLHDSTALVLPGHPRLGVTIVQWIEKRKSEHGLEIEVLEGISSFAAMINILALDPIEEGTVLLDVNRILLFDLQLNPHLNYFIYHVCSIGTSKTNLSDPTKNNRIDLLTDHLSKFFPKDHLVTLVSAANSESSQTRRDGALIKDLSSLLPKISFASTLFVPAVKPKSYNKGFYELISKP